MRHSQRDAETAVNVAVALFQLQETNKEGSINENVCVSQHLRAHSHQSCLVHFQRTLVILSYSPVRLGRSESTIRILVSLKTGAFVPFQVNLGAVHLRCEIRADQVVEKR